jgi:hypothetical protein
VGQWNHVRRAGNGYAFCLQCGGAISVFSPMSIVVGGGDSAKNSTPVVFGFKPWLLDTQGGAWRWRRNCGG